MFSCIKTAADTRFHKKYVFNDFSQQFGDVIESQDNYPYQPISGQFQSNTYMFKVIVATRSSPYPDQMVTAVTWIQSVSRSDGGSAPRDDLYSSECQRRPGHLDEPQRQIPSEDPVS